MEREISSKLEASTLDLVKEIDTHFGMVFLEYYASRDGKLSTSQEDSISRALSPESKSSKPPRTKRTLENEATFSSNKAKEHRDDTHKFAEKEMTETPLASNTSLPTAEEQRNDNTAKCYQEHFESSFDRLYHNISSKEELVLLQVESSTTCTDDTSISETTETQTSRTKLRQELLREIMQVTDLLRQENDELQRKAYEQHLNNLRTKFNQHIEEKSITPTDGILVLDAQNRINTNENIITGFRDMPTEKISQRGKKLVFEFETASRSLSKEIENAPNVESELKFINIVASTSMCEGYLFDAKYQNKKFLAKVPKGGVQKGQLFTTPMLNPSGASSQYVSYELALEDMDVPRRAWRDGFCNCFKDPLFLLSFIFPHVALSQIQSRMQLMTKGKIVSPFGTKFLIFYILALLSLNAWTAVALIFVVNRPQLWLVLSCTIPLGLLDLFVIGTFIAKTIKTRKAIREFFDIEEQNCRGSEDVILGVFCSCCSISQMGRHTADYQTYRENFLSPTGLPRQLEMIVPKHTYRKGASEESMSIHSF